jgi:tRNA threonylcarbamoyladenosine biosynthesis protein TsaB
MERGQDARLMPMIVGVMAHAKYAFSDLDKIGVIRGPGSFTGLRIGLAAARGIGLAAGKPVIGIGRFDGYRVLHPDKELFVVIQSKRAELFCQYFPAIGAAHEPRALTHMQIADFIVAHPGISVAGDDATPDDNIVSACAQLAAKADAQNPEFTPRPLYLRAPDVTFPSTSSR